ncbi:hypothetical protein Fot_32410 [Forsythia ovata]|uniref:Uncharacterized protein n=1 Tax=Forsythia ovata TaxID=205694 RepID=A0ABD1T857_9LAMI
MAEMNTARSHLLNYELYKVLAGYKESKAIGSKDSDELHLENKILFSKLDLVKEARWQAEYKAMKAETIQKVCNNAKRRAELKLKVYKDMAYAKYKELDKVREPLLVPTRKKERGQ